MLTSSDPVSEGLAFLGAMTGESDPSKSNWKRPQKRRQNPISLSLPNDKPKGFKNRFHQL